MQSLGSGNRNKSSDGRKTSEAQNLKMSASMKVKAGIRLLMAEARVGELMLIPLYPIV